MEGRGRRHVVGSSSRAEAEQQGPRAKKVRLSVEDNVLEQEMIAECRHTGSSSLPSSSLPSPSRRSTAGNSIIVLMLLVLVIFFLTNAIGDTAHKTVSPAKNASSEEGIINYFLEVSLPFLFFFFSC